ncbi:MAG TPA: adenylate/guanylate cyclase domain-containing protein [Anaeromyxobacter sp.]|nr:adenylate/guanylate cyclase domain-containing protein [Anaeromyxobacter sp.]
MARLRSLLLPIDALRLALLVGLSFAALAFLNGVFLGKGVDLPVVGRVEQAAQDQLLTRWRGPKAPSGRVVIVAIDERSVAAEGRWPWSRAKMARLVDRLAAGGVIAAGFDVVFSEEDETGQRLARVAALAKAARQGARDPALAKSLDDLWQTAGGGSGPSPEVDPTEQLADAIERAHNVSLGFMLLPQEAGQPASGAVDKLRFFRTEPVQVIRGGALVAAGAGVTPALRFGDAIAPVPALLAVADSGGFVTVAPDRDGIIRHYPAVAAAGGAVLPSLGLALLARVEGHDGLPAPIVPLGAAGAPESLLEVRVGSLVVPTDEAGRAGLDYLGSIRDFPTWSATDVLDGRVSADRMRGRIAVVGTTAVGTWDQRVTPFDDSAPGVVTHVTFLENALAGEPLQRTSAVVVGELALLVVLATVLAWAFARGSSRTSVAALALGLLGWTTLAALALRQHYLLSLGLPAVQMLAMFGVATTWRFVHEEKEKRRAREIFSRFLAPSVVEDVLAQKGALRLGGEKRELTVLFSDVRGFTSISERLEPQLLLELLNQYLTPMTEIIVSGHEGTLDKYIGDAIMAFWGAPHPQPDHALRACRAALAMLERLAELRRGWREKGLPDIDIGVGINTGPMSVGFVGSEDRFYNYTVLGDAVNLASRLEGTNKQYGTRILLGEETRAQAGPAVVTRPLDRVRVKGKREPVVIHELLGLAPAPGELLAFLERFAWGLSAYQAQRWGEAVARFREADQLRGGDPPSQVYLSRCEAMRRSPPGPQWDGVFEMKTK